MAFKTWIKAPPEKVYASVSDLTRHAKWAAHQIKIEPQASGPLKVGSTYKSHHVNSPNGDLVTVTEMVPNQRFGFKAVMPNKLEFQHSMSLAPQNGGTALVHDIKFVKGPPMLSIMMRAIIMPLATTVGSGGEKKFLNNLKTEVEQGK